MSRRRWYPKLTADSDNGLLRAATPTDGSLVICHQGELYRRFSIFSPISDFAKEFLRTRELDRCYYEVILGDRPQKPYFDIDISAKEDNISEDESLDLIKQIKDSILVDSRIRETDILVFTSHGSGKLSYHIVINNWCLPDVNTNKIYCHRILDRISDGYPLKKYIDHLVYKSIQQFRTYGSTKRGKDRWKIEYPPAKSSSRFDYVSRLYSSLVTNTNSCRILEYKPIEKKIWDDTGELTDAEISIICKLDFISDDTFLVQEPKGRLIPLKRLKPSFCIVCQRIHENENPYLTLSPDSTKIYFHCRRIDNDKQVVWEGDPPSRGSPARGSPARGSPAREESLVRDSSKVRSSKKALKEFLGFR